MRWLEVRTKAERHERLEMYSLHYVQSYFVRIWTVSKAEKTKESDIKYSEFR